jgi:hypothetical protein
MSDGGAFVISIRVYWKKAASESGSYTVTHTAGNTEGIMYCISGADGTTPLSPNPTFNFGNLSNGQTTTATGLTTPAAGCLVIMSEALYDSTTGMVVPTGTTPTFTARRVGTIQYVSDGILASAGATGNKSHTNGNASAGTPWVATLISVQPSAAPAALNVTGAQTTLATTQAATATLIGAVTGAQTTSAATQSATASVLVAVTGAQTTQAAVTAGDITLGALPALNVTGAQTTLACLTTGIIGDVQPELPVAPVAPGGPSRAAQRRLKQAVENRSRFEAERARRLANLTNDRPLFVTPPETLEMINETLVEDIDHSVLFENEDQDEELLLLLMMI